MQGRVTASGNEFEEAFKNHLVSEKVIRPPEPPRAAEQPPNSSKKAGGKNTEQSKVRKIKSESEKDKCLF